MINKWVLKWEKVYEEKGYLHSPELIPSKYLCKYICQGGKKLHSEEHGRHHPGNQVIEVNIANYKTRAHTRQTQNEGHSIKLLNSTLQRCQSHERQGQRNHYRSETTKKTW